MRPRGPPEPPPSVERRSPRHPRPDCPVPKQPSMPPSSPPSASPLFPVPPRSHPSRRPHQQLPAPDASMGNSHSIPPTDGFVFGICAAVYELFLYKRLNGGVGSAPPPSALEVLIIALGVGLSIIGLAWWTTPGLTYSPHRTRLLFLFRLHHLASAFLVPVAATCGADARSANPTLDFLHALVGHGWVVGALTMILCQPLPLLPTLLLNALTAALIPYTVAQSCVLPFMEPLEGRIAATLRLLLRPAVMRPLRGIVGMLGAPSKCQVMFITVHSLLVLGLPFCLAFEAWTKQQHAQHVVPLTSSSNGGMPVFVHFKTAWLRLPFLLRLLGYVLWLQLAAAAVVWVCLMAGL